MELYVISGIALVSGGSAQHLKALPQDEGIPLPTQHRKQAYLLRINSPSSCLKLTGFMQKLMIFDRFEYEYSDTATKGGGQSFPHRQQPIQHSLCQVSPTAGETASKGSPKDPTYDSDLGFPVPSIHKPSAGELTAQQLIAPFSQIPWRELLTLLRSTFPTCCPKAGI